MLFEAMEKNKYALHIEDYSVSQTTLDQVFLNLARTQEPPKVAGGNILKRMCRSLCICCVPEYVVKSPVHHRDSSDSMIAADYCCLPTGCVDYPHQVDQAISNTSYSTLI